MNVACLICLESFESSKLVVSINGCGHVYHQECLEEWKKSQNKLSNSCPTCRKPFNKRSLKQLFLGIAESDNNFEKDIQNLKDEKQRECNEKNSIMNELIRLKTEYGIKLQAYNLLDTINADYLAENTILKEENLRLQEENKQVKQEMELLKIQIQLKPHVIPSTIKDKCFDLTSEDDDRIAGNSTALPEVVEIRDEEEDDDVLFVTEAVVPPEINLAEPETATASEPNAETENERATKRRKSFDPSLSSTIFKKPRFDHDFDFLEEYILSQI